MQITMRNLNLKYVVPLICALIGAIASVCSPLIAKHFGKESPGISQEEWFKNKIVAEARDKQKLMTSGELNNNYSVTLVAEDKAYLCALCDGVRKITEQFAAKFFTNKESILVYTATFSYPSFNIYSRTYVRNGIAVEDCIRIDYLNASNNEVIEIEVKNAANVSIKGPFSILSFKDVLKRNGFVDLESTVESDVVEIAIRYDSNNSHLAAVGEAAAIRLPDQYSKDVNLQKENQKNTYDGFIINATGFDFRPALINRIVTPMGLYIYDPSKLPKNVLIKEGCGEYALDLQRATVALKSRGVRVPLIINAVGTSGTGKADLVVPDEIIGTILLANERTHFLSEAKVAFVIGKR